MTTDPDVDDLLGALRADLPTPEDAARMRTRLIATGVIAASATAGTTAGAATLAAQGLTVGARVAALSFGAKLAVVTAVSVSVGAGAVATFRSDTDPAPKPTSSAARVATSVKAVAKPPARLDDVVRTPAQAPAVASANVVTLPSARAVPKAVVVDARPAAPARTNANATPGANAAPTSLGFPTESAGSENLNAATLREERALVDAALIALQAGNSERATTLLDAHGAKFPNGLLRLERERARAKITALSAGQR